MHYDFVDIGTCDFDTSLDVVNGPGSSRLLLVDPLGFYLDKLPNYPSVIKDCVAVGNVHTQDTIYYLSTQTIEKFELPWWLRGCSSIGKRHPALVHALKEKNLGIGFIDHQPVEIITFDMLCDKHNITSINSLKIDTEGHEQYILPDVLNKVKLGFGIQRIKFENQAYLGNKTLLDSLVQDFVAVGYQLIEQTEYDVVIEKIIFNVPA